MAKQSNCHLCGSLFTSVMKGNGKWTRFCSQDCFNMWRVGRPHPHTMPKFKKSAVAGSPAATSTTATAPAPQKWAFTFTIYPNYFWQTGESILIHMSGNSFSEAVRKANVEALDFFSERGYKKRHIAVTFAIRTN